MPRKICIFGYPDKTAAGFPSGSDLVEYIAGGVFSAEGGRHRHTLRWNLRDGDIIVLSRDATLYGHIEINGWEEPNDDDRAVFPKVRRVYLVRWSAIYENPVLLSNIGNPNIHFGTTITEDQFQQIGKLAGAITYFSDEPALPKSTVELERVLRAVKKRLGQSDFRRSLLRAYGNRCAVTECDAVDALEAAHIDPYSGPESNQCPNGLLLRADIHTLFDLNLLSIDPATLEVALAPRLSTTSYANLHGRRVRPPANHADQPDRAVLARRWQQFGSAPAE